MNKEFDKTMSDFLGSVRQSFFENPGVPHCSDCWRNNEVTVQLKLNEDGDLECFGCGLIIEVEKNKHD